MKFLVVIPFYKGRHFATNHLPLPSTVIPERTCHFATVWLLRLGGKEQQCW